MNKKAVVKAMTKVDKEIAEIEKKIKLWKHLKNLEKK
jgi:hypothetical protein